MLLTDTNGTDLYVKQFGAVWSQVLHQYMWKVLKDLQNISSVAVSVP